MLAISLPTTLIKVNWECGLGFSGSNIRSHLYMGLLKLCFGLDWPYTVYIVNHEHWEPLSLWKCHLIFNACIEQIWKWKTQCLRLKPKLFHKTIVQLSAYYLSSQKRWVTRAQMLNCEESRDKSCHLPVFLYLTLFWENSGKDHTFKRFVVSIVGCSCYCNCLLTSLLFLAQSLSSFTCWQIKLPEIKTSCFFHFYPVAGSQEFLHLFIKIR